MENSNYDKFKALAYKKRLTADDKETIVTAAAEYGISLNTKCSNCYRDAAIQIALANKPQETQEEQNTESGYVLKRGIDITLHSYRFGTMHICAKTCNTANARKWLQAGIPRNYFAHIPDEN